MNGKSSIGGAYGFKLNTLEKLSEIKSCKDNNCRKNLLHFIFENNKNLNISCELNSFEISSKFSIDFMNIEIDEIQKQIINLKYCQNSEKLEQIDEFQNFCQNNLVKIKNQVQKFKEDIKKTENLYQKACYYFCENYLEISSNIFFEKFLLFFKNCLKLKKSLNISSPTSKSSFIKTEMSFKNNSTNYQNN